MSAHKAISDAGLFLRKSHGKATQRGTSSRTRAQFLGCVRGKDCGRCVGEPVRPGHLFIFGVHEIVHARRPAARGHRSQTGKAQCRRAYGVSCCGLHGTPVPTSWRRAGRQERDEYLMHFSCRSALHASCEPSQPAWSHFIST